MPLLQWVVAPALQLIWMLARSVTFAAGQWAQWVIVSFNLSCIDVNNIHILLQQGATFCTIIMFSTLLRSILRRILGRRGLPLQDIRIWIGVQRGDEPSTTFELFGTKRAITCDEETPLGQCGTTEHHVNHGLGMAATDPRQLRLLITSKGALSMH